MKILTSLFLSAVLSLMMPYRASAQEADSVVEDLTALIRATSAFSRYVPREKVYLHLDNTSYLQGEDIRFSAYVVRAGRNMPSPLSRPLYVELLNPGGKVVDRKILKIEDGRGSGSLSTDHNPFYPGYYEVRAYTKYMLNFGESDVYSRVVPVTAANDAAFAAVPDGKPMSAADKLKYSDSRPSPEKVSTPSFRAYPEGGHIVAGAPARVAFEITGRDGQPIEATGYVIDKGGRKMCSFVSGHLGRGVMEFIPESGREYKAVVELDGKSHSFRLPTIEERGISLTVDNLSSEEYVRVTLRKSPATPPLMMGGVVTSRGELRHYWLASADSNDEVVYDIDRAALPTGVSQITIFDTSGNVLADRLVFINHNDAVTIEPTSSKAIYEPYEKVEMDFTLSDKGGAPVNVPFSLSVRDADASSSADTDILSDMLLASDIKGFVKNPGYYFETADQSRAADLDLLMMVQGWRKYPWGYVTGAEPLDLRYLPEQGIEVHGRVTASNRKTPKPDVTVSSFLVRRGDDEEEITTEKFVDAFTTDSLGHFAFVADVEGKWNLILSAMEGGKKKNYKILLDRVFTPAARAYDPRELHCSPFPRGEELTVSVTDAEAVPPIDTPKGQRRVDLRELTVKGDADTPEARRHKARATSAAYYDVQSEREDMIDAGSKTGDKIHDFLVSLNNNFARRHSPQGETLVYKGKEAIFVLDHDRTYDNGIDSMRYQVLRMEAIESVYINEDPYVISMYCPPELTISEVFNRFGCVVIIETFPRYKTYSPADKGVRKTWLDGYSAATEFYSPDYSQLPPDPDDRRRTLYWNPAVKPDSEGKAKVTFYNNSSSRRFSVSAATVTPDGRVGFNSRK